MSKLQVLKVFAWVSFSIVVVCMTAQAQVLVDRDSGVLLPTRIDPSLLDHYTGEGLRRSPTCSRIVSGVTQFCEGGVLHYRFNNVSVDSTNTFSFDVEIRAEDLPVAEIGSIDANNPGNVVGVLQVWLHLNTDVVGENPDGSNCGEVDSARGFLNPAGEAFPDGGMSSNGAPPIINDSWLSTFFATGPNDAGTAAAGGYRIIPNEWTNIMRRTCTINAGQEGKPARLAFNARMYGGSRQLVGASTAITYATRVDNQFWYFPLDGVPAILEIEVGNGIANELFYMDVEFSEGVYGTTSASGPVEASAFNFFSVSEAQFTNGQVTETTRVGTTFAPTSAVSLNGEALVGGETVVRLYFAEAHHPNVRSDVTPGRDTIFAATPSSATETIYDSEGNQLRGGPDWHLQVKHDRFAPYISEATVGLANQYIDVTFSEAVKFDIAFNAGQPTTPMITNTPPAPNDFVVIHHSALTSRSTEIAVSIVTPTMTVTDATLEDGLTALRLGLPAGASSPEDTFDIRIAEQVKDRRWPSLASVFDLTETKETTGFPRTAAPAQVAGLQGRDREQYTVAFTQASTDQSNVLDQLSVLEVADPTISTTAASQFAEGDEGSALVWGVLVTRDDTSSTSILNLEISFTDPDNLIGVEVGWKVADGVSDPGGFNGTTISETIPLEFGMGDEFVLVAIRLAGNTDLTGTRELALMFSPTNSELQATPVPPTVTVISTEDEDEDEPIVYTPGNSSVTAGSENTLQSGSLQIDDAATVTEEGASAEGVANIVIQLQLQNAAGTIIVGDGDFTRNRVNFSGGANRSGSPVGDQTLPGPGGQQYALSTMLSNSLPNGVTPIPESDTTGALVLTVPTGSAAATPAQVMDLVQAITFFLRSDDDDIGETALMRVSLVPPTGVGGNEDVAEVTYTLTIAPDNDTARVLNAEHTVDEDSPGEQTFTVVESLDAVETGHLIGGTLSIGNLSGPALFESGLAIAFNGADIEVKFTLAPNAHGSATFEVNGATDDNDPLGFEHSLSRLTRWMTRRPLTRLRR